MKQNYFLHLLVILMLGFSLGASAQQKGSTTGKVNVGYAKYNDYIYEYDGLSLDHNAKVGCAVLLTKEMLAPYVGGTITGMRVGWDTTESSGKYEGFVRNTFNGENLATGSATVKYSYSDTYPGWNNMTLTNYVIPEDVEQLVVGFTTSLKKDVCAIPTLYPHGVKNSNFLWVEGDTTEDGQPVWVDMCERGILPILLTIKDSQGTFNFLPAITSMFYDGVIRNDQAGSAMVRLRNNGSVAIKSIEVTSRQGEQNQSQKVTLSSSVNSGMTSGAFLIPVYTFESGDLELSITKVNDTELEHPKTQKLNVISVPAEVAAKYHRRPLVEYFESENSYMSPRYYDEIVGPSIKDRFNEFTYVSQHLDDQFMTGEDDATILALKLCDNDSAVVSIPAMTVDRAISTRNINYQQNVASTPMFPVLYEPYATNFLNTTLTEPTFLSVEVSGSVDDWDNLTVTVGGDASDIPTCMPEGEKPCLTVYLMERNVQSDSQLFWTDKEKEATMGEYTHVNVIREVLSDPMGDKLEKADEIKGTYHTTLAPDWNKENLYLVAFVHRDGKLGGKHMHVFNSSEGSITFPSGILDLQLTGKNSSDNAVYDLQGRRVYRIEKGIFIHGGKKVIVK